MIVPLADLLAHLGLTGTDAARDAILTRLLVQVEAAFLRACGRSDRPFLDADPTPRAETYDGTGTNVLWVRRPVAAVTSVVIGPVATPRETLAADVLVVVPGSVRVRRTDGGTFGALDEPAAVTVTYTNQTEAPDDAKWAVLRASAALWLQRGAEDVRAESEGGVRAELAAAFDDPSWQLAVAAHREIEVG